MFYYINYNTFELVPCDGKRAKQIPGKPPLTYLEALPIVIKMIEQREKKLSELKEGYKKNLQKHSIPKPNESRRKSTNRAGDQGEF